MQQIWTVIVKVWTVIVRVWTVIVGVWTVIVENLEISKVLRLVYNYANAVGKFN